MQPEHLWYLCWKSLLNILVIVRILHLRGIGRLETRTEVHALQQLRCYQDFEVGVVHSPVPIVCNVPTIHDLAKDVTNVWPWYFLSKVFSCIEVVAQHLRTDSQVAIIEWILLRPPLWAELDAARHESVKEAQRKERGLKLPRFGAFLDVLLRELRVRAPQVRLEIRGSFVSNFDALLQDRLRKQVPKWSLKWAWRLRCQHAPEVMVGELLDQLQCSLQGLEPRLHQMNILQHHPSAFSGYLVGHIHS
mmetsp:Transcript_58221/g.136147  ORF Transcript_58221/g.136147 Transcript_58221/m.136147 type:complete len:248 (-) Transcript_58221:3605-4348(-)